MTAAAASALPASFVVTVLSEGAWSDSAAVTDADLSVTSSATSFVTVVEKAATGSDDDDTVAAFASAEVAEPDPVPTAVDDEDVAGVGEGWELADTPAGETSSIGSDCDSAWSVGAVAGSASSLGAVAGSASSVGAVSAPLSSSIFPVLPLVCAPPLLLTTTPGATSVLVDVAPVVVDAVVSEAEGELSFVASLPAASPGDAEADDDDEDVSVDASADEVDSELDDAELDDAELDDSEPDPVASALAKPGEAMTIAPMPSAAASAPTRPT